MGLSVLTERLVAPLRRAPRCCVKVSSPIVRHPFGGGSQGGPASLGGGGAPLPVGGVDHGGAACTPG
eukprot:5574317-Alexandrium_andersonii.AAC.1